MMQATIATPRTLRDLGWQQIQEALAAHCMTVSGAQRAGALGFYASQEAAMVAFARLQELANIEEIVGSVPLGLGDDVRPALARAQKNALLDGQELLGCGRLLQTVRRMRLLVAAHPTLLPLTHELTAPLGEHRALCQDIEAAIAPSGALRDDASPALYQARQKVQRLQQGIKDHLDAMLKDVAMADVLQDTYVSLRGERYVLPVVASFQSRVKGIVHSVSQTGQTVFIEPQEVVNQGNALAMAHAAVEDEERKILAALSSDVAGAAPSMGVAIENLGIIDLSLASARLAKAYGAHVPNILAPEAGLSLKAMRHPLLVAQGMHVVPNDVVLAAETSALVISGPNAGGKTATLTAVGLCVLMGRAGLAIPAAEGSGIPWVTQVACVVGDAQDIRRGLSSFSGHVALLRDIVCAAQAGWLVLIDEIAADTDPQQGAALARATLEALVAQSARIVLTTHLEELKALAVTEGRFANASVALNPDTLAPTYTLQAGVAGYSRALSVAQQVGMPGHVVQRAQALLSGGDGLGKAMDRLQERESDLARARQQVQIQQQDLAAAIAAAQAAQAQAKEDSTRAKEAAWEALAQELGAYRDEARSVMVRLQAQPTVRDAQRATRQLEEAERVAKARAAPAPAVEESLPMDKLNVGMRVHARSLGQDGEVLAMEPTGVLLLVGTMRVRVKPDDLGPAARGKPKAQGFAARKVTAQSVAAAPLATTATRCDVRGMRGDDAERELEAALDRCLSRGERSLLVVHGHGTGALKKLIREILQRSPYVESFRPGTSDEGGDGTTRITLTV